MRGCRSPIRLILCLLALLMGGLPANAAETLVLLEESFESPVVDGSERLDPPGWVRQHGTGSTLYTGLWNESNDAFTTPFGSQVLSIWSGNTVTTTNITDRLQAGVTYTLTFHAGNSRAEHKSAGINTYKADILAGTNVIASVSATTDTNDMSEQGTVSIETDGDHPNLGEILGVRFQHYSGGWEWRTLIDNVKLVAVETDEFHHALFIGK